MPSSNGHNHDFGKRLIDVRAAASRLSVADKTLRRLIDAGKLPGVCRIGTKLIRIDVDELDGWITEGCPPLSRYTPKGRRAM